MTPVTSHSDIVFPKRAFHTNAGRCCKVLLIAHHLHLALGSAAVLTHSPAEGHAAGGERTCPRFPCSEQELSSACLQRAAFAHLSLKANSQPSYQTLGSNFHTGLLYLDSRFPLDPKSHTKTLKVFSLLAKENTEDFI